MRKGKAPVMGPENISESDRRAYEDDVTKWVQKFMYEYSYGNIDNVRRQLLARFIAEALVTVRY